MLRDGDRIFLMRRTRAGGDERLHERYSIGIGGHVNPGDTDPLDALRREWAEEIEADFEPTLEPLGVLNDDDNAVGAVHLGLVFAADAGGRPVAIRERDKLEGGFATDGRGRRGGHQAGDMERPFVRIPENGRIISSYK